MKLSRAFDLATSYLACGFRLASALRVGELGPRPDEPFELYEFEACPFCRRVREALTLLDLDAYVYPCPKGGERYRPIVRERSGRLMFPYFLDPNTGVEMNESTDIVAYLWERYGVGEAPWSLRGPLFMMSSNLASVSRVSRGRRARGTSTPREPLELYSFEGSPYCRLAREALCELEIPYLLHNVAKGSPRRRAFVERSGKMQVPYLVDPNTGTEMFESDAIVEYLTRTYG